MYPPQRIIVKTNKQHHQYTLVTKKVLQILAVIITFIIIITLLITNISKFILGTRLLCEIYVFCILSKVL